MNESCKTCEYFCPVRKSPMYEEVVTHICVNSVSNMVFDYICEVTENDMCECYMKRRDHDEVE